jgi:hypothetical protein
MTDDLSKPPDVSLLTREQASTLLDQMTKDHVAANPDLLKLSPEQADQALQQMAKAPPAQVADPIGAALKGELRNDVMMTSTLESPMLSPYKLNDVVSTLREIGFPDAGIRRILEGTKCTAEDVAWARREKDRVLSDQGFIKKYLEGSRAERHWMTGLDALLSAGAAEKAS